MIPRFSLIVSFRPLGMGRWDFTPRSAQSVIGARLRLSPRMIPLSPSTLPVSLGTRLVCLTSCERQSVPDLRWTRRRLLRPWPSLKHLQWSVLVSLVTLRHHAAFVLSRPFGQSTSVRSASVDSIRTGELIRLFLLYLNVLTFVFSLSGPSLRRRPSLRLPRSGRMTSARKKLRRICLKSRSIARLNDLPPLLFLKLRA